MLERISILCSNEFVARYILRNILAEHADWAISCICVSEKEFFLQRVITTFRRSGLKYTLFQILNQFVHLIYLRGYNIRKIAKKLAIPILSIKNINNAAVIEKLASFNIDLIVSIQFDQIIKKSVFAISKYGIINFHKAMLPKYRGMAPLFWALLNMEKSVGVTVHYMDLAIDTAPILVQMPIEVEHDDTLFSLYEKCAAVAPGAIKTALRLIDDTRSHAIAQDDNKASYFSNPTRNDVRQFLKNGNRFISIKNLFTVRKNLNGINND